MGGGVGGSSGIVCLVGGAAYPTGGTAGLCTALFIEAGGRL